MITLSGAAAAGVVAVAFGGWSLAAYFFRLVYTGRLVPAHDRDEWRAESRIKDAQIGEKDKQLEHMGEIGHTVESFLGAFQKAAAKVEESP